MIRYIVIILSIVLSLGCYAQRKNNNVVPPKTQQQTTPKKSQPKTKKSKPVTISKASGTIDGHEYVDLGLPSGLLWATCNVGANRPEYYGDYFAWGETCVKSNYYEHNYATNYIDYTWLLDKRYIDVRGNLMPEHDAACVNWGSTWRMPTADEIDELIENTSTTWATYNGIKGRLVKSKRNGKSIFIPAAGVCVESSYYNNAFGNYWISTMHEENDSFACILYLVPNGFNRGSTYRYCGLPVRPVSGGNKYTTNDTYSNDDTYYEPVDSCAVHYYVDLGLPSGLKWATCNVGADSPEDYGYYFAWGETSPKNNYSENNSATHGKNSSWLKSNGCIDYKGDLSMSNDAANYYWCPPWRLPTKEEIEELLNNTTATWAIINGVNGQLLTSKRNGECIFFPAGGFWRGSSCLYDSKIGSYWSSSSDENNPSNAYHIEFDIYNISKGWNGRSYGRLVRPVFE